MAKGHLSTKIPGQRLRPPPQAPDPNDDPPQTKKQKGNKALVRKGAVGAARRHSDDGPESEDEEEGNEMLNVVSKPFQGVIVCFTGVKDKPTLMAMAHDMGAMTDLNLTDTVTHLVASEFTSEKYKVALTLGLPILTPEWLRISHATWVQGGEVELAHSVEAHRLPPFRDLRICLTNFEKGPARDELTAAITSNFGTLHSALDKTISHLVYPSANTSGAKIDWAKRTNADLVRQLVSVKPDERTRPPMVDIKVLEIGPEGEPIERMERKEQKEIRIVREEWIWDCVRCGGRWGEEEYGIERRREDIKPKGKPQHVPKSDLARQDSTIFRHPNDNDSSNSLHQNGHTSSSSSRPVVDDRLERAVIKRNKRKWGTSEGGFAGSDALVGSMLSEAGVVLAPAAPSDALSSVGGGDRSIAVDGRSRGGEEDDEDMPDASEIGRRPNPPSRSLPSITARPAPLSHALSLTSRLSTISRSSSFSASTSTTTSVAPSVASTTADLRQTTSNLHLNKNSSSRSAHPLAAAPSFLTDDPSATQSSTGTVTSFPYKGFRFLLRLGTGALEREIRTCIVKLGGEVLNEEDAVKVGEEGRLDWVVGKLATSTKARKYKPPVPGSQAVTQHWVESCYREDRFVPLDDNIAYRPLNVRTPVPGAEGISICTTKIGINERRALMNLVRAMGGSAGDYFSNTQTSHLICSPEDISGPKYDRSLDWKVPALSPEWVYEMARTGVIPELDGFRLGASVAGDNLDRTAAFKVASSSISNTTAFSDLSSANVSRDRSSFSTTATTNSAARPFAKPTALTTAPTLINESAILRSPSLNHNTRPLNHSTSSTSDVAPHHSDASSKHPSAQPSPSRLKAPPSERASTSVSPSVSSVHVRGHSEKPTITTSRSKKPAKTEFKLTSEIKALIDEADTSTSDTSALISPEVVDEKPAKRKRILGRPASARLSITPSRSNLSSDNLLANTSVSSTTAPLPDVAPPPVHEFLPSASYRPNSPPSSDQADGYADESLRVVYHDAVAAKERERLIRRLKGQVLSDDEAEAEETPETQPDVAVIDLSTQAAPAKGRGGGRGKAKAVESLAGEESIERRRSGRLRK